MSYHYTASGLDRVFLATGYAIHATPYGEAVAIEDVDGLHRTIARALVCAGKPITGAEFRFIRKHLDQSQKALAALIGAEEQAISRWERAAAKPVPGMADRLLRVLFLEQDDPAPGQWILHRLADGAVTADADITLTRDASSWRQTSAA